MTHKLIKTDNYLLVVDDSEIKVGDNCLCDIPAGDYFGVVAYNGAFAEHYYKKVIAHLPLNAPILEGVDLLPPYSRHQEDGVDNAVMEFKERFGLLGVTDYELSAFSKGYNKAREKYKYTEEDMIEWTMTMISQYVVGNTNIWNRSLLKESLPKLNQYPTEFECEMENYYGSPFTTERCPKCIDVCDRAYQRPKTTTNAHGQRVWVGKYK